MFQILTTPSGEGAAPHHARDVAAVVDLKEF
jgi:hypothetical protein